MNHPRCIQFALARNVHRLIVGAALLLAPVLFAQSPWSLRNQRSGGDALWGITSGASGLVAVGTNGAILHSADGEVWTRRASNTSAWLTAVTFGKGRYVAVGDAGRLLGSNDGITWTSIPQSVTTQRLNNVLFAQDQFVAVGENGTIILSVDGTNWTAAASGTNRWLRGLSWGQNYGDNLGLRVWIATGQEGAVLFSSDNGRTWDILSSQVTTDLESVAFTSGAYWRLFSPPSFTRVAFTVVGQSGILHVVEVNTARSAIITPVDLASNETFRCLVSGGHYSFAAKLSDSSGSVTRGEQAAPTVAIAESGTVFTAYGVAGADGTVYTDYDTTQAPITNPGTWSRTSLPSTSTLFSATYVTQQQSIYAVGQNETIYRRDQVFSGRLGNLSARAFVDQGDKVLAAGFVVNGSTPKSVLIRGVGPALANFGVAGALTQPSLTLFDSGGRQISANTGWTNNSDPAAIANAAASAGAFPFPDGSKDSALRVTLNPGLYSAVVAGNGASGIALVEIYDLDGKVSGFARAINLSTRGLVGAGANVLIAGVSVQGPAWRRFLVRGVGPSLTKFGVAGALPDPVLSVTQTNPSIPASRAGQIVVTPIRDAASILAATNAVGAFALDAGGQDDAFIIQLPSGSYTFQVASKTNSTGVALIEVYEVGLSEVN